MDYRVLNGTIFGFQVPQCVKELSPSAWNPPPGGRRLAGLRTFNFLYSYFCSCVTVDR